MNSIISDHSIAKILMDIVINTVLFYILFSIWEYDVALFTKLAISAVTIVLLILLIGKDTREGITAWVLGEIDFAFYFVKDQSRFIANQLILPDQLKYIRNFSREDILNLAKQDGSYLDALTKKQKSKIAKIMDVELALDCRQLGAYFDGYEDSEWKEKSKQLYLLETT